MTIVKAKTLKCNLKTESKNGTPFNLELNNFYIMRRASVRTKIGIQHNLDEIFVVTDIVSSPREYCIFAYNFTMKSPVWARVENGVKRITNFFPMKWKEKYPNILITPGYYTISSWYPVSLYKPL